eukprot:s9194_g1.t1
MSPQQQENARCLVPSAYRAVFDKLIAERERCGGWDGAACIFAQTAAGGPANLHKQRAACLFCDPPRLSETCSTVTGRGRVLACMRRMATTSREAAVARVPEEHRGFFVGALAEIPGLALGAPRAGRKRPAVAVDWNAALARRRHHRAPPSAALNTLYRKQVLDDRARARRRFGIPGRAARGETVVNDTGLPPPKRARSELAADLYDWCEKRSWGMCAECYSLLPLPLTEATLKGQGRDSPYVDLYDWCEKRSWGMCAECYSLLPLPLTEATLKGQGRDSPYVSSKQCPCCRATVRCAAPVPSEVPEALRGLTEESLQALTHLRLDVGPEIRASNNSDYRQHATMARFFWQSSSTSTRIRAIQDPAQRQLARNAKKHLMRAPEACRRRLQFIETPGLETSLWPHLFYKDSLCLTVVRSTDARRVGRARGPTLEAFVRGDADSDTDDAAEADGRRHSVKRAYSALALSAHLGYGSRYDVLHFAYDLNLWSALGAKKTTSREYDVPMRVLMKGHSFSPLYWRGVHCALLDMVRQLGYPKIFWTISLYEWSMPYHVVRGVLAGRTGHASRDPWQRHLLQAVGSDGDVHPVHVFLRVEFQDGTRKAPTQDYHGSGRPHIHVLVFASTEAVQCMPLPETVSATMPAAADAEDILPGLVRGSQLDRKICAWLKRHHATDSRGLSLEDFATNYVVRGEKLVAADMLSRLNDKFYGQWLLLHVPFRDPEDFHVPVTDALDRVPTEHRNFAMVVLCEHPTAKAMWRTDAGALEAELRMEALSRPFAELRMEALSRPFVTTLLAMATAHRELVHKYLTGAADVRSEERRRDRLRARPDTDQDTGMAFNAEQRHLQAKLTAAVERALAVQQTVTEADADELLQEAYDQGKIFVCTGGPGTGKTTTALAAVRRTLSLGGEVLFTYPTNRQASRMRAKLPATVAVDTFHAAFALDEPPGTVLPALARYALIVVDEISQLQQPHFEHICKLWNQADNLPAILMAGDELQMAGFGPTRAWHSPLWRRMIYRVKLHKTYRCKDPAFNHILQELRTSRPGAKTLKWLQGRKAWAPPQSPSVDGIRKLLKAHPETVVLTCTRRGAQTINDLALRALFPRHDPLAVLPADDVDFVNGMDGQVDVDFVNGMDGQVVAYNARSKAVEVVTTTQHRVVVWPWTYPDLGNLTYYPLKAGYADTIVKFQGAELTHVTAYLDCPGVPGAAYTALSRVSYGKDILIGGAVTAAHFQPVDEAKDG